MSFRSKWIPSKERKKIRDAVPQGSGLACNVTFLSIGKITNDPIPEQNCDTISTVVLNPRAFVDDIKVLSY